MYLATPDASMEREESAVTIAGQGFVNLPSLACRFGLVTRPAQFISSELIICRTPAESEPGTVHLEVTLNGVDFSAQGIRFKFLSMATLRRLTPEAGLVDGGAAVIVEGSGFAELFREGLRANCRWEMPGPVPQEVLETRAAIITDSNMTCVSPPAEEPGRAQLSVVAGAASVADQGMVLFFEYEHPAMVVALVPSHGKAGGGTRINITGEGFVDRPGLVCRFSFILSGVAQIKQEIAAGSVVTLDVPAMFVTSNKVQCLSPARKQFHPDQEDQFDVEHVLVEVSNHGWTLGTQAAHRGLSFWYRAQPKVN